MTDFRPEQYGWIVAGLLLATWLISILVRLVMKRIRLRTHHQRGHVARQGENESVALLESQGYRIDGSQVFKTWCVWVDGDPEEIRVFADHIVIKDGLRFVAEVKTGDRAPSIHTAATRRQLLEYYFAFEPDGLLLVDMEEGVVRVVEFDL